MDPPPSSQSTGTDEYSSKEASKLVERTNDLEAEMLQHDPENIFATNWPDWDTLEGLDPLGTDRKRGMHWYYEKFGVKGLNQQLAQIALDEATRDAEEKATRKDSDSKVSKVAKDTSIFSYPGSEEEDVEDIDSPQSSRLVLRIPRPLPRLLASSGVSISGGGIVRRDVRTLVTASDEIESDAAPSRTPVCTSPPTQPAISSDGDNDLSWSSTIRNSIKEVKNCDKSWRLIFDDHTKSDGMIGLFYLTSLHPQIIDGLIKGDLPRQLEEDKAFAKAAYSLLQPIDRQGVYAVYNSIKRQQANTLAEQEKMDETVGMGLSPKEVFEIYEDMKKYINVDDRTNMKWAEEVDNCRTAGSDTLANLDYRDQRRYGGGKCHDDFRQHEAFLNFLELHHVAWFNANKLFLDDEELNTPLRRCFAYVGLSNNVLTRSAEHSTHSGKVSPVFGLFTALLEMRYKDKFEVKNPTYQIFRTIHPSHVEFDEKLLTLLASAYPWDGGLSTAFAGHNMGKSSKQSIQLRDQMMAENLSDIERHGYQATNLLSSDQKIQQNLEACQWSDYLQENYSREKAVRQYEADRAGKLLRRAEILEAKTDVQDLKGAAEEAANL